MYSFLVYGDQITLIDTGVAGCEKDIFDYIRSTGRDPSEIALIILTHSHPDHIGAARAIKQLTGCSIAAHPAERAWIEDVDLQNRERPVPGFATLVDGSVSVDHELADGDTVETDEKRGSEILVFHIPGHSKGSISLFLHSEGALFCGDAVPVAGGSSDLRGRCRIRAIGEKAPWIEGDPRPPLIMGRTQDRGCCIPADGYGA